MSVLHELATLLLLRGKGEELPRKLVWRRPGLLASTTSWTCCSLAIHECMLRASAGLPIGAHLPLAATGGRTGGAGRTRSCPDGMT